MTDTFPRRLSMLTVLLVAVGVLMLARLGSFQFQLDTAAYLQNLANNAYHTPRQLIPDRGRIFDRNGELLAGNEMYYDIGVSPNLITDKDGVAQKLASVLGIEQGLVRSALDSDAQYIPLTKAPVGTDLAQQIARLNIPGVVLDPKPRRIYPQGALAGPVLGFVSGDGIGYVGVEGALNSELTGQTRFANDSPIPFEVNPNEIPQPGDDVYLTIDRSLQYLAETELQSAIQQYKLPGGSLIIMDPRNGEILAMASYPSFDPNAYYQVNPDTMRNRAVSDLYEPGSVFKIVTLSSALDSGKVPRNWTYDDHGVLNIGGRNIRDWDGVAHGSTSFDTVLIKSYNIGTSEMAMAMTPDVFYHYLADKWGVNARTGVDLEGEATGVLHRPGDPIWSDSYLATNSFGQGLQVTPLQMLCYANVIADDGKMMQPHIVLKRVHNGTVYPAEPFVVRTPVSADAAHQIRDIMVQVVAQPGGEGHNALVKGYTIAGKTGTAQVYNAAIQNYDPTFNEASFVGFLPADEPRVSILIKLDQVPNYASQTAAPVFADLVKRLVVLMNIPTDAERAKLQQSGGITSAIIGIR
ncbi:MAG: peptidoglycan D,D-transpeptidase FtsI family protein [Aggregatilineales bacterium]